MSGATDAAVWQQVKASMPLHDCGRRLEPGGNEATGHVLVCTDCSYVAGVSQAWVMAQVNAAWAAVEDERGAS